MSFGTSMTQGYNVAAGGREMERRDRQEQLTAMQHGYEIDPNTGEYTPTQRTSQETSLKEQQMEAAMQAMQSQIKATQSQLSADGITNTLDSIINGDWHTAGQHYSKIRDTLSQAKGLNVTNINPVNFNDPKDRDQLLELGISMEDTPNDETVIDALNRSLVKVTGHDGNTRIMPVDSIMKSTNTWNMMNTQQRDRYTANSRNITSILTGAGILTASEEEIKETADKTAIARGQAERVVAENTLAEVRRLVDAGASTAEIQKALEPKTGMSMSEQKTAFELGEAIKDKAISDYVDTSHTEFMAELDSDSTSISIGGKGVPKRTVAKSIQGDNKLGAEQEKFMAGMYSTVENTIALKKKLEKSNFNWDAMAKGMAEVAKITGPEFLNMSKKEQEKLIARFEFDSELKTVMAGYIKAMSGAAVSDQERAFYQGAILGGNWATKEAAMGSMKGFINGVKNGYGSHLKSIKTSLPATYLDKMELFKKLPGYETPAEAQAPAPQAKKPIKIDRAAWEAEMKRRGLR